MTTAITGYWAIKDRKEDIPQGNLQEVKLREDVEKLVILLSNNLVSEEPFEVVVEQLFNEVFKLRLKFIKWASSVEKNMLATDWLEVWFQKTIHIREEKYEVLISRIFFMIKTWRKVLRGLKNKETTALTSIDLKDIESIQHLGFDSFMIIMKLGMSQLPAKIFTNYYQFIRASLIIELSIIAADILLNNSQQLLFSQEKIRNVSDVLYENTKMYRTAAINLDIMPEKVVWDNSNSKATQEQIDELAREVNKAWWQKNKDKIMGNENNR